MLSPSTRIRPESARTTASSDCTKVDFTIFGGSLANWAFVWLAIFTLSAIVLIVKQLRQRANRRRLKHGPLFF